MLKYVMGDGDFPVYTLYSAFNCSQWSTYGTVPALCLLSAIIMEQLIPSYR